MFGNRAIRMTTPHTILKDDKRFTYIGSALMRDNSRRAIYRDEDGKQYRLTLKRQAEALKQADDVVLE